MPDQLMVNVTGLQGQTTALGRFARSVDSLESFWRELAQSLADEAQSRWPLRRRTGKLRKSLTWAGNRLGRGGIFEADPDRLQFGTAVFYGRFHQFGAKNVRRRPLIHINPPAIREQLATWAKARAVAAGLEVS